MRIIFAAYRDWGIKIHNVLSETFTDVEFLLVKTPDELDESFNRVDQVDLIICVGWSWIIKRQIVDDLWVVGIHPSDLPNFAGGSPLQNQILAGISQSKNTLFRLSAELDSGPVIYQLPLNLSGHMQQIFDRLIFTSVLMISDFIRSFPDGINFVNNTNNEKSLTKRLRPEASKLSRNDLINMTARQLYDHIRCHEDPYPNSYIEDETGRLIIKICEFEDLNG